MMKTLFRKRTRAEWLGLVPWIIVVGLASAVGSQFMPGQWYDELNKPPWNPPSWVFGPVWTVLYVLMAISAWLVWEQGWRKNIVPLGLFMVQLVLNGMWSWLFFGLERPDLAFYEIVVLWLFILATVIAFWRVRPLAGVLLVPYLLWVSFATLLNYTLWQLNQ